MATLNITSSMGIDMLDTTITDLFDGIAYDRTPNLVRVWYDVDEYDEFKGSGFTYDQDGVPVSGTVTEYKYVFGGLSRVRLTGASVAATTIVSYAQANDAPGLYAIVLSGADTLNGNAGADALYGYGGHDKLYGNGSNDTLNGGSGNDLLDGGSGSDMLYGGTGDDTFRVDSSGDQVFESAGQGTDKVVSSVNYTLGSNVENLTLSGSAIQGLGNSSNNTLRGNAEDNVLWSYGGNDVIRGLGGDDTLNGGSGNDRMFGGTGDDVYVVDSSADEVNESSGQGIDTVWSYISYRLSTNLENLGLYDGAGNALGNSRKNIIQGNDQANTIKGFEARDILWGEGGNDLINGGSGEDAMHGGAGNDTFIVDSTGDKIFESAGGGTDTVKSSVSHTLDGQVERLTLTGTADKGIGQGLDNTINGNNSANELKGKKGDDVLKGKGGGDQLEGGYGADSMYGGGGKDLLTGAAGKDVLFGDAGSDTLKGGGGEDRLNGGDHADLLLGGAGADRLIGGKAADLFAWIRPSDGKDLLTDFSRAQSDKLRVTSSNFGNVETGTLRAKYFVSNTNGVAMDANDFFTFSTKNDALYFDADGNGAGSRVKIATFNNGFHVQRTDITVI